MEKPSKQPSLPQVTTSQSSSQNADNHAVILCTAGYDRTIRFWEALSGICSRTIQHPDSQVNKLAISADKKYLAVAGNPNTRIYEALSNNGNSIVTLEGHTANVTSVAFHASNKWIVTGSEDGNLKIFDLRAKGAQREFSHKCPVNDVVIHPNQGEIISCDLNGSIKFWDMSSNSCVHELVRIHSFKENLIV
jgi:G protein beta subunit-like protein